MKTNHAAPKDKNQVSGNQPLEIFKQGNVSIPIYRSTNIVPERDADGRIIYGEPDASGKPKAKIKYQSDSFTDRLLRRQSADSVRDSTLLRRPGRKRASPRSRLPMAKPKSSNSPARRVVTTSTRWKSSVSGSRTFNSTSP